MFEETFEDLFCCKDETDIFSLIRESSDILQSAGVISARIDSELLLCKVLRVDRAYLYAHPEESPGRERISEFSQLVNLRKKRIPVQYLVGKQEFWSRDFIVTEGVLIPRPETERLIEIILADFEKLLLRTKAQKEDIRAIDIGTGTGIIPVILKCEMPFIKVFATDISSDAIKTAKLNAKIHIGGKGISFIKCRGLESFARHLVDKEKAFHIIVSNPPYIPDMEIEKLDLGISRWEPREALSGGENGTDMIKLLIEKAPQYIYSGGILLLETGEGQREIISSIAESTGKYDEINFFNDYSSKERVARLWIK